MHPLQVRPQAFLFLVLTAFCMGCAVSPGHAAGLCPAGFAQRLHVHNNCAKNAIMFLDGGTCAAQWGDWSGEAYTEGGVTYRKTVIAAGDTVDFCIPDAGACSGNMKFAYDCSDTTNGGTCVIAGGGAIHTRAEITFGCKTNKQADLSNPGLHPECNDNVADGHSPKWKLSPADSYDVTAVDGYTIPISIIVNNQNATISCSVPVADGSMLDMASCPKEYGYNASQTQTFGMTLADKTTYQATTFNTLATTPGGISLLTTADGSTANIACASPCKWFSADIFGNPPNPQALVSGPAAGPPNTFDFYCCANSCGSTSDQTCTCPGCRGAQCSKGVTGAYQNATPVTNYVKRLKELGYEAGYTWQYDDALGLGTCSWNDPAAVQLPDYTVELCPNGGDPPVPGQKWAYSGGRCVQDAGGSYASLFECQSTDPVAKTKYKIITSQLYGFPPAIPNRTAKYCAWDGAAGTLGYETCLAQAYAGNLGAASVSGPSNLLMLLLENEQLRNR